MGLALNFVEVMALQRMFSVGRFKCSGASAMVTTANFPHQGYDLMVRKNGTRKRCFGCFREFIKQKPALKMTESVDQLTIYST